MHKFIYTEHALQRIEERNIPKTKIEGAILHPDKISKSFGERTVANKKFRGKILEVIYRKENSKVIVITAYWPKEV